MITITLTAEEEVLYLSELEQIRELIPELKVNVLSERVPLPVVRNQNFDQLREKYLSNLRKNLSEAPGEFTE
ncbi:MAG: hypothetical protein U0T84_10575 [Chitinophagales bacterium]